MPRLAMMPVYIDDFEAATTHLTPEEDGIYFRLMRLSWRRADCALPADRKTLARLLRIDEDTFDRVAAPLIEEFFQTDGKVIWQRRLVAEFRASHEAYEKRAAAGSKGGRQRAINQNKDLPPSNATAGLKPGSSNAQATRTLTGTVTVLPSEDPPTPQGGRGPSYSDEFEGFWRFWQKDLDLEPGGKAAAWRAWGKLSSAQRKAAPDAARKYAAKVAEKQARRSDGWNGAHLSTWLNQGNIDTFTEAADGPQHVQRDTPSPAPSSSPSGVPAGDRPADEGELRGEVGRVRRAAEADVADAQLQSGGRPARDASVVGPSRPVCPPEIAARLGLGAEPSTGWGGQAVFPALRDAPALALDDDGRAGGRPALSTWH